MIQVALAGICGASLALTQPNGSPIPAALTCAAGQPVGLAAVFACTCTDPGVCNIGAPCVSEGVCDDGQNSTCETTLSHVFNDNACIPSQQSGINVWADADISLQRFRLLGPGVVRLASRGSTTFQNALAWYNATGSAAPATSDLHTIVDCAMTPGAETLSDVNGDPAYTGGAVGLALLTPESHSAPGTCAGGNCCATVARLDAGEGYAYYSESMFDPDHVGDASYIHLLSYQSRIEADTVMLAWEGDRMGGGGDTSFTDLVVRVKPVTEFVPECAQDADCDDSNPCTADSCASEVCAHAPSPGTSCSDGLACNGTETCDAAGACTAGPSCDPPAGGKGGGCGHAGGAGALLGILLPSLVRRARARLGSGRRTDPLHPA